MIRRAHDGKFTGPTLTAPLMFRRIKSAPHVKGAATRRERQKAKVWAVKVALDRELGRA